MDDAKWYIRWRGKVTGPYTLAQLEKLQSRGQISRLHEVSQDRRSWARASTLTSVFAVREKEHSAPAADEQYELGPQVESRQSASEPARESQWFYSRGDNQFGPFNLASLQMFAATGGLGPNDLVWEEGSSSWVPARRVGALSFPTASPGRGSGTTPADGGNRPARTSALAVASLLLGMLWLCAPLVAALDIWPSPASMVQGLLWFGGIGSVLAIVFGGVALKQIKESGGRITGRGLAITGLVLGLIFIGLVTLLLMAFFLFSEVIREWLSSLKT